MELNIKQMQEIQLDMLRIIAEVCEGRGIPYLLHAGNLLGAVRHGGPIPWDSDVDILVPENRIDEFCRSCAPALSPKYWIDYYGIDKRSKRHFPRIAISGCDSESCHIDVFRLVGLPGDARQQAKLYKKARALFKLMAIKRRMERDTLAGTMILWLLKPLAFFIPFGMLMTRYNTLCNMHPYGQAPYAGYLAGKYGRKNCFRREIFEDCAKINYSGLQLMAVRDYDTYLRLLYGDYMRLPPESERERAMGKVYYVKEMRASGRPQ